MADTIFLSHASEDKGFVQEIKKYLEQNGFEVWYDEEQISGGDRNVSKIEEGLRNSIGCIFFLSKRYLTKIDSGNTEGEKWIKIEYDTAIRKFLIDEPGGPFIPLIIKADYIKSEMPEFLKDINSIDFTLPETEKDNSYKKLIDAIRSKTGSGKKTDGPERYEIQINEKVQNELIKSLKHIENLIRESSIRLILKENISSEDHLQALKGLHRFLVHQTVDDSIRRDIMTRIGKRLLNAILSAEEGREKAIRAMIEKKEDANGCDLNIILDFGKNLELIGLPWELICFENDKSPLYFQRGIQVLRRLPNEFYSNYELLHKTDPSNIRVLLIFAVDDKKQFNIIKDNLEELKNNEKKVRIEFTYLGPEEKNRLTLNKFKQMVEIRGNRPDIIHYIGSVNPKEPYELCFFSDSDEELKNKYIDFSDKNDAVSDWMDTWTLEENNTKAQFPSTFIFQSWPDQNPSGSFEQISADFARRLKIPVVCNIPLFRTFHKDFYSDIINGELIEFIIKKYWEKSWNDFQAEYPVIYKNIKASKSKSNQTGQDLIKVDAAKLRADVKKSYHNS